MIKSKVSNKTQLLSFDTKIKGMNKNNFNDQENSNSSDPDYYNFSDSSLELFDTFKPKPKLKKKIKKNVQNNDLLDTIDLTNDTNFKLNNFKGLSTKMKGIDSKIIKKKKYSINDNNSSIYIIDSSSDESCKFIESFDLDKTNFDNFKTCDESPIAISANCTGENSLLNSRKNVLNSDYNGTSCAAEYVPESISEYQSIYTTTPKEKNVENNSFIESAKLLDRFYGKKRRNIDGIIKNSNGFEESKKKNLNEVFENNIKSREEKISNKSYVELGNSLPYETSSKANKHLKKKDFPEESHDTSIILEKINLSNDSDNLSNNQMNDGSHSIVNGKKKSVKTSFPNCLNKYNDVKQNNTAKSLKKDKDIKKNKEHSNQKSKIPFKCDSESQLSFLSSLSCFTGTMKCDPLAEKYKFKFKKNKDDLVSVLFKLFNKEVFDNKLPTDMDFKWNARLRSTAGACFNKRSVKINDNLDCVRVSRIELSSKIIDTAERLRDTLIHELCHAACWIFNGVSEGHGPSWKSWVNKAMQKFPELPILKRCHSYSIQTKFTYRCKNCGYSFGRHSKSLNLERKRCGYCYGEFELLINKMNNPKTFNSFPAVSTDPLKDLYNLEHIPEKPKPPKKPSKFALYVKENYSRVKRENPLSKHGEIMKLLGSQFATTKLLTPDKVFDKLFDD